MPRKAMLFLSTAMFFSLFNAITFAVLQSRNIVLRQENLRKENNMRLLHALTRSFPSIDYSVELSYLNPVDVTEPCDQMLQLPIKEQQALELKRIVTQARRHGIHMTFVNKNARAADGWLLSLKKDEYRVTSPLSPSFESIEQLSSILAAKGAMVQPDKTFMRLDVDARNRTLQEARNVYKNILAVEQLLNHLQPETVTTTGQEPGKLLRDRFVNLQEAYRAIDVADTFQSLVEIGFENSAYKRYWRHRIIFGMTLTSGRDSGGIPETFQFRGLESSTNPTLIIAWVQLATKLVQRSCDGYVLEPAERTINDAWSALFSQLIQDDALETFFLEHQKQRRGYWPKLDLIKHQLYKVWDHKFGNISSLVNSLLSKFDLLRLSSIHR